MFSYCTQVLRLSEDAACNRIDAARACLRFPLILDLLASGALSLTSVRLLAPHLTPENHGAILARASGRRRREIEALVAELAPRPDVPSSLRRLPVPAAAATAPAASVDLLASAAPAPVTSAPAPPVLPVHPRPIIQATSPQRYRLQFTISEETHDALRRLQALLRREVPDGDPGILFDRAIRLLLEKTEKAKLGAASRPRPSIRRAADSSAGESGVRPGPPARTIPPAVKHAVWIRDGGRCAFVSATGRRCDEETFLEYHHVRPYARQGPATVANISLRCRRHNQYEAEIVFGPFRGGAPPAWRTGPVDG